MIVTLQDLRKYSAETLAFLEKRGIATAQDFESHVNTETPVNQAPSPLFRISLRPSNLGTQALSLEYVFPEIRSIPLNIRANPSLQYVQFILKCQEQIPEYAPFSEITGRQDEFGNPRWYRVFEWASFYDIAHPELQRLSKL